MSPTITKHQRLSTRGWHVADGEVHELDLGQGLRWPRVERFRDDCPEAPSVPLILAGGPENLEMDWTINIVADIATRLTPWAGWVIAPGVQLAVDENEIEFAGRAFRDEDLAIIISSYRPHHTIAIAFHEAWHLVEWHLSAATLSELDRFLLAGPEWPNAYYCEPCERRARSFQAFAMSAFEGIPVSAPDHPIFADVYNGEWSARFMSRRAAAVAARGKPVPSTSWPFSLFGRKAFRLRSWQS